MLTALLVAPVTHAASLKLAKKAFTHPGKRFSIQLPNGWKENAQARLDTDEMTILTFLNPAPDKEKNVAKYQAYVNVLATPATSAQDTLDTLVATVKQQIAGVGGKITKERKVKVGGIDAVFLDLTVKTKLTTLHSRQGVFFGYGYGYIVTTHSLQSAWKKYDTVFDQSLRSFRVLHPTGALSTRFVEIKNFAFGPATLTVTKGDTIRFSNLDTDTHTVTSDTGAFDSGPLASQKVYELNTTQLARGTYTYHCTPHSGMTGSFVVQ